MMHLEQQHSDLEKENAGLHKDLKDCHILLVAAKVDPGEFLLSFQKGLILLSIEMQLNMFLFVSVLGERVAEAAQENEIQQKKVMVCIFFFFYWTKDFYEPNIDSLFYLLSECV